MQTSSSPIPSDKGKKRRLRILFFLIFVFTLWAAFTWHAQGGVLAEKKEELEQRQAEIKALQEKRETLEYEIKRLHDEEYIAELARKYYFLSKPGEVIFVTPE